MESSETSASCKQNTCQGVVRPRGTQAGLVGFAIPFKVPLNSAILQTQKGLAIHRAAIVRAFRQWKEKSNAMQTFSYVKLMESD